MKLSAVLIVKNEEELLPKCLASISDIWDELVVVDTGSEDRTIEIALERGARVEHFQWRDNFSAARNYAESQCQGEYVLWIDADEILLEGHQLIRQIVEEGVRDGVAPKLIYNRDRNGHPVTTYMRQELLHKRNGQWRWMGVAHNYLVGGVRDPEPRIVMEHFNRPSGDRPNFVDTFAALRENFKEEGSSDERSLFYLLREHFYKGHYHETIALTAMMVGLPANYPPQRARACILAGDSWNLLGNAENAIHSYYRSLLEHPTAEGFYSMGNMCYTQGRFIEAVAWLQASTVFQPQDFFADTSLYVWRRWDLLARCLYKIGEKSSAAIAGAKALEGNPADEQLKKNMEWYTR